MVLGRKRYLFLKKGDKATHIHDDFLLLTANRLFAYLTKAE